MPPSKERRAYSLYVQDAILSQIWTTDWDGSRKITGANLDPPRHHLNTCPNCSPSSESVMQPAPAATPEFYERSRETDTTTKPPLQS